MSRTLIHLRLAAFLLDLLLFLFIVLLGGYLITPLLQAVAPTSTTLTYLFWRVILLGLFVVFLLRDRLGSPGKRIFGLSVKSRKGEYITAFQSLLRNVVLFIPILNLYEAHRFFFQSRERLGDLLARTAVNEI